MSRLGVKFLCPYCQSEAIVKSGKNCNGKQRYQCKYCHKRFITDYTYKAYLPDTDSKIIQLTKEGLGIRSTVRVLGISVTTLFKRILQIVSKIKQPPIAVGRTYEVDEMRIFIGKKSCLRWLAYALDREINQVVAFNVGRRTNRTLSVVLHNLFLSKAKFIYTPYFRKQFPCLFQNLFESHLTLRESSICHFLLNLPQIGWLLDISSLTHREWGR